MIFPTYWNLDFTLYSRDWLSFYYFCFFILLVYGVSLLFCGDLVVRELDL